MKKSIKKEMPFTHPSSTQEYLVWIIKIGQLMTKRFNQLLLPFHLTFNQVSILFILQQCCKQKQQLSMHKLSEILVVSLANTSGLVDRLERDKYVKRKRNTGDRRTNYLELTNKGAEIVEKLQSHWPPPGMKELDTFFKDIPQQEQKVFIDILNGIGEFLQKSK